jgi:excisionase family DNA binding protein
MGSLTIRPPERLFLSVAETAHRIGRSEEATRRLIERGLLPARRWGRRVVVFVDDLETFARNLPRWGDSP